MALYYSIGLLLLCLSCCSPHLQGCLVSVELNLSSFMFVCFLCNINYLSCSALPLLCRCQGCEVVLSGIEEQVSRANQHKEQQLALKQQIESEVSGLRRELLVPLT